VHSTSCCGSPSRTRRSRCSSSAHLAVPLQQVRVDHPVLSAVPEQVAAPEQPPVPLRNPARRVRSRRWLAHPESVDRGRRDHRDRLPRRRGRARRARRRLHPGWRAILIYRRRTVGPVFSATTRNDKIMYVLLVGTIVLGLGTAGLGNLTGDPHDYRDSVSPWFRSIFTPAAATRAHGRGAARLPAPRNRGLGLVCVLALQPPRARLLDATRLSHPALHRLPQPRHPTRQPCPRRGWERTP
jgi:hypothetical protein